MSLVHFCHRMGEHHQDGEAHLMAECGEAIGGTPCRNSSIDLEVTLTSIDGLERST